jgi:hypothetical protein
MNVRQSFNPVLMGANASYNVRGDHVAGFLPKTAGTIAITGRDSTGLTAVTLVDAVPVAAGVYVEIPLKFPVTGGTVTLAGGASGTLFI